MLLMMRMIYAVGRLRNVYALHLIEGNDTHTHTYTYIHTHTHTHTHTFDLVDRNFVSEFTAEAFIHYRLDGIFL